MAAGGGQWERRAHFGLLQSDQRRWQGPAQQQAGRRRGGGVRDQAAAVQHVARAARARG